MASLRITVSLFPSVVQKGLSSTIVDTSANGTAQVGRLHLHPDKAEWLSRKIILDTPQMRQRFPRERGKDYNHSTFCDIVISGLVGFVPKGAEGFLVEPLFPPTWDYLTLENLRYRGHDVAIRWQRGKGLAVTVDSCEKATRLTLGRLFVCLKAE